MKCYTLNFSCEYANQYAYLRNNGPGQDNIKWKASLYSTNAKQAINKFGCFFLFSLCSKIHSNLFKPQNLLIAESILHAVRNIDSSVMTHVPL